MWTASRRLKQECSQHKTTR